MLHFDGYSIGNITSPDGTLVLTKRGRIEADINVGVAVIGGWVTGNITASDHVVLESEARVTGQIRTPALSVRLGAVFDGDCIFTTPADHKNSTQSHCRNIVAPCSNDSRLAPACEWFSKTCSVASDRTNRFTGLQLHCKSRHRKLCLTIM